MPPVDANRALRRSGEAQGHRPPVPHTLAGSGLRFEQGARPMNDSDLANEFIRQEAVGQSVHVLVRLIEWHGGPANPTSRWKLIAKINIADAESKLGPAIRRVLDDRRYFGRCEECGERNPAGWMHSEKLCQSCAEANHGVVY